MTRTLNALNRALVAFAAAATMIATPVLAQAIQSVDPNTTVDSDLEKPGEPAPYASPTSTPTPAATQAQAATAAPTDTPSDNSQVAPEWANPAVTSSNPSTAASQAVDKPAAAAAQGDTYKEDDLIGAAQGVFGKGAEGLAKMIKNILAKQGEPNAYIVGREAGAALGIGLRYGSGTLYHKIEGKMPVYWTGPSIGFDAGANAGSTFVLVYNLYDTADLYKRFPAAEGQAYVVGGLTASYMRRGDVVIIPIRMGAGLRLGVNAGYMKFSHKQRWLPF
ncbi:DUF1134 domain-containing protein [Tsuneonella mangrovi]|uniref:DUF1134 domain-containing protein n=1 Tax=Tsuneonella mangrovi TaxID=1982042 RepID=UPI000BA22BF9|nr:DUF1134 domain-containing protein [Tsuneonella mangrovi]